eukprot:g7964.t1
MDQQILRPLHVNEAIHAIIAPLNFMRKPNGKIRPTIDFRDINTYLQGTQIGAIESVGDVMDKIDPDWTCYSVVDIVHGYGSIPIDESLSKYFAIHWKGVTYGFVKLPQGVNISPELFNQRMTLMLENLPICRYFDDLLIGGINESDLFNNTCAVLQRFSNFGLTINLKKCSFFEKSIEFLGTELNEERLNPSHRLTLILNKLPEIKSRRDVQKAMGLCMQVSSFCFKYNSIVSKLKSFLVRDYKIDFTKADRIFKESVNDLCKNTYNLTLKRTSPFHLFTDWAGNPINQFGYFLCNDEYEPCLFGSTSINDHFSSFLGELFGVVFALKQIYKIVRGSTVHIYSDNKATVDWLKKPSFLHKMKDLRVQRLYGWLTWHFPHGQLEFHFIEGNDNGIADLLSRWKLRFPVTANTAHRKQGYIEGDYNKSNNEVVLSIHALDKEQLLKDAHRGHFGITKTLLNLHAGGHKWKGDYKDVRDFIKNCEACQQFRRPQCAVDLGMIDSQCPNHTLCMDHIGPLQGGRYGHKYIVTGVDSFTKMGLAITSRRNDSKSIIKFVQEWIKHHGCPCRILSDRGAAFISREFKTFCKSQQVDVIHTPPYSHKSAGTIEKFNNNVINRLRRIKYETGMNWSSLVKKCIEEINRTVHLTTMFTPLYLMHGVKRDGSIANQKKLEYDRELAFRRIVASHDKANKYYQKRVHPDPISIGSKVSWYNSVIAGRLDRKLASRWMNPCTVVKKQSEHLYDIKLPNGRTLRNVHRDFLRPYYTPKGR